MSIDHPTTEETFDPYHIWLGIPPQQRPLNYYVLLGIHPLEKNADVIQQAADRQMAHLRTFQNGGHSKLSQRLLNEVAQARNCLLNKDRKRSYDNKLRIQIKERRQQQRQQEVETAEVPEDEELSEVVEVDAASPVTKPAPQKAKEKIASVRPAKTRDVTGAPPRKAPAKVAEVTEPEKPAPDRKRRWLMIGAAAAMVLVVFVGGLVALLSRGGRSSVLAHATQPRPGSGPAPGKTVGSDKNLAVVNPHGVQGGQPIPSARPAGPFPPAASTASTPPPEAKAKPAEKVATLAAVQATEGPVALPPGFGDEESERVARAETSVNGDLFADPADDGSKASDGSKATDAAPKPGTETQPIADDKKSPPGSEPPKPSKLPIPAPEVQRDVEAVAQETFRKELNDSRTPEQRTALAKRFLETAQGYQAGEPARYVMFMKGAELAAEGGGGDLVIQALDGIAAEYEIDALSITAELLERSSKSRLAPASYDTLLRAMVTVVERALATDRMEIARDQITSARAVAVKTKGRALLGQVNELNAQVRDQATRYAEVRRAMKALDSTPDDPSQHFIVGSYRCFVKGEWQAGLPHLAKCNDKDLAELAKRSLAPPTEPPRLVELGDRWWDRASTTRGREQQQQLKWACHFYKQAVSSVHGLTKTKIEKRIAEAEKTVKK